MSYMAAQVLALVDMHLLLEDDTLEDLRCQGHMLLQVTDVVPHLLCAACVDFSL